MTCEYCIEEPDEGTVSTDGHTVRCGNCDRVIVRGEEHMASIAHPTTVAMVELEHYRAALKRGMSSDAELDQMRAVCLSNEARADPWPLGNARLTLREWSAMDVMMSLMFWATTELWAAMWLPAGHDQFHRLVRPRALGHAVRSGRLPKRSYWRNAAGVAMVIGVEVLEP